MRHELMSEFIVALAKDNENSMPDKRLDALWEAVYRRMKSEFISFRDSLFTASTQELFDAAYEIKIKQDILTLMENHDLSAVQLDVLEKQECPLDKLYKELLRCDSSQIKELGYCVDEFVNNTLRNNPCKSYKLELPSSVERLNEALREVHIIDENQTCLVEVIGSQIRSLKNFLPESADIYELNYFSERLSGLDEWQRDCFEGLCAMEAEKMQTGQLSLEQLINLTFNLKDCQVVYEAKDDKAIGKFYAENDFIPELDGLSDKVWSWLDFEKIGREMREAGGGVLMPFGYVVLNGVIGTKYISDMCPRPSQSPEFGQTMGGI